VAAIAAVRPAPGHEFLAPEVGDAIAALAGVDLDPGFVDEFHGSTDTTNKKALPRG
jgi:hypothetical protein